MEQITSAGKPVQITVIDGYELVKLFLEIWEVPSLFILLESLSLSSDLSCHKSVGWGSCVGSTMGRNGVLHHPVSPNLLAVHSNGPSSSLFLTDSLESAVHITVCIKYLAIWILNLTGKISHFCFPRQQFIPFSWKGSEVFQSFPYD